MAEALFGNFGQSGFSLNVYGAEQNQLAEPKITDGLLAYFTDDCFAIKQPIPLSFERTREGYIASFASGNFAVGGLTKFDALHALEMEILDAFEDWTADESALGPGPKQQLAVLKQYIDKA